MKVVALGAVALFATLAAFPAGAQTFQGPYIGAQAGWNHDEARLPASQTGGVPIRGERDAFTGGGFIGYNEQITPSVVIGVEGSFDVSADDVLRDAAAGVTSEVNPRFSFDAGVRAGYLVTPSTLLYVRGGYKNMQATVRRSTATTLLSDHRTFDGWTLGGGVERLVADHVTARIEYRYSDLGPDSGKLDRHQALFGVAYHF